MTAEILIMNQNAVAMASDSAATISGPGTNKIRNHAIKLFSLSKYAPVGVMIYNQSSLLMYPWETLIKEFRRELGTRTFDHVHEYLDEFLSWLKQNEAIKDRSIQDEFFRNATHTRFHEIFDQAFFASHRGEAHKKNPVTIVNDILDAQLKKLTEKNFCDGFNEESESRIIDSKKSTISSILDNVIYEQNFPEKIDEKMRNMFIKYSILPITRNEFRDHYTGIIIIGFGNKDIFPSYSYVKVGRVFDKKIRIREEETRNASINNRVVIQPFAQTDVVDTITSGIAPDIKNSISGILLQSCIELINTSFEQFEKSGVQLEKSAINDIIKITTEKLSGALNEIINFSNKNHYAVFEDALVLLPKEELASIAETLVELTSFKRRVSTEDETVGGPVDVMVITKGDGLIWVKRKHYFDEKLNHQFFKNYFYDRIDDH